MVDQERLHRNFIDHLHAHSVGKFVELPQIAVIGDTSSGKSSLLSAIAGITFPSNDQLTTRCPIRLRTEKNSTWSATISITRRNSSGPPWHPVKASTLENITAAITTAQDHILASCGKQVAEDVVEIHLQGPDYTDLTIVDLPGIVRTVGEGEARSLVQDIRNLIDSFLSNKRCIILAVVPANVDFHNSQILADAEQVDPKTERTIPVITKPDLIDIGAESGVLDLLLGHKKSFSLGFHVTKCRGQKALNDGVTLAQGIEEEDRFFSTTEPWKRIASEHNNICGTYQLKQKLAKLQVAIIEASVPSILEEILALKEEAADTLTRLGTFFATDSDRRNYFSSFLRDALSHVGLEIQGRGIDDIADDFTWCATVQELYSDFRDAISASKLANIVPNVDVGSSVFAISSDGTEFGGCVHQIKREDSVAYIKPTSKFDERFAYGKEESRSTDSSQYKAGSISNFISGEPFVVTAVIDENNWRFKRFKTFPFEDVRVRNDWLIDEIAKNRNEDLPCFLNASLFNSIVSNTLRNTVAPVSEKLFRDCFELLSQLVSRRLHNSRYARLDRFVKERLNLALIELAKVTEHQLEQKLIAERKPFTLNHYLFDNINKRRNERLQKQVLAAVAAAGANAAAIKAIFEQNTRMSMEQQSAEEMEIVLDAYGKVASKRISDDIPQIINSMLRDTVKAVDAKMTVTDEELRHLMVEDAGVVADRKRAQEKFEAMEAAEKAIIMLRSLA